MAEFASSTVRIVLTVGKFYGSNYYLVGAFLNVLEVETVSGVISASTPTAAKL